MLPLLRDVEVGSWRARGTGLSTSVRELTACCCCWLLSRPLAGRMAEEAGSIMVVGLGSWRLKKDSLYL